MGGRKKRPCTVEVVLTVSVASRDVSIRAPSLACEMASGRVDILCMTEWLAQAQQSAP